MQQVSTVFNSFRSPGRGDGKDGNNGEWGFDSTQIDDNNETREEDDYAIS